MPAVKTVLGFAVIENDEILTETISGTQRAAVVNYLVAYRMLPIYARHSDADIFDVFKRVKGDADLAEVKISPYQ